MSQRLHLPSRVSHQRHKAHAERQFDHKHHRPDEPSRHGQRFRSTRGAIPRASPPRIAGEKCRRIKTVAGAAAGSRIGAAPAVPCDGPWALSRVFESVDANAEGTGRVGEPADDGADGNARKHRSAKRIVKRTWPSGFQLAKVVRVTRSLADTMASSRSMRRECL